MVKLPDNPNEFRMSLGEHLDELRRRLLYALCGVGLVTALSLVFGRRLIYFVVMPVQRAVQEITAEGGPALVVLSPTEAFIVTIKTAFIVSVVISSPWVLYQLWLFVAAGLYRHERRVVYFFVPFSAALFIAGTVFAYTVVLKHGLRFLLAFAGLTDTLITPSITLASAVSFVTVLSVVMGAVFQLPLVMMILAMVGITDTDTYIKNWRYAVGGTFLVAAVMTPPDVFTQVMMAGPMIALYWLGVGLSKVFVRKKQRM